MSTIRLVNINHQRLHVRTINTVRSPIGIGSDNTNHFNKWLVGFTDGDGTFTIDRQQNGTKWNLVYKISQNKNNAQILYYIKTNQGIGQISKPKDDNWSFRIRQREQQKTIIFPIFDKIPQITKKEFDYKQVKEAASILDNISQDKDIKNKKMEKIYTLLKTGPNKEYKSRVWKNVDCNNIISSVSYKTIISKQWLIGFWEAEGSFYIVNKGDNIFTHGIGQTQKEDPQIQEVIRQIFGAKAKIKDRRPQQDFYSWDSTNKKVIVFAKNYFKGHLKGRASQIYSIWKKSINYKGTDLLKSRNQLRKIAKN